MRDQPPTPVRRSSRWCAGLGCAVLALAAAAPRSAAPPSLGPLFLQLDGMRNQIKNASVKLKNGIVGTNMSDGAGPRGPAESCCGTNLARLGEQMAAVGTILDGLGGSYLQQGNRSGVDTVNRLEGDLQQLTAGIEALRDAPEQKTASGILDGVTRAYLQLRDGADLLQACCAPAAPEGVERGRSRGGKP